jgi:hypothetical protein
MTIKSRTKRRDRLLKQIIEVLKQYDAAHAQAEIEVYRQNSVSVRIRVIDPDFEGKSRTQREDELWSLLGQLPEETVAEISLLLLFTPEEAEKSFANLEFENPIPSRL